jgi:DNA polymerase-3 subunit epsilon
LKKCQGACIGEEAAEDYNERARAAMEALDSSFELPSFFLIDHGRQPDENAVVMVEQGAYRGFGFASLAEMGGRPDELRDVISPYEDNPEVRHIIRRFLGDAKGLKMIPFFGE